MSPWGYSVLARAIWMAAVFLAWTAISWGTAGAGILPLYVSPVPGSSRVSPHNNIVVRFPAPLDRSRVPTRPLEVIGSRSGSHPGRVLLLEDARTLHWTPDVEFALDETVQVRTTVALVGLAGESVEALDWSFRTTSSDPAVRDAQAATPGSSCGLEPMPPADPEPLAEERPPAIGALPADLPAISLLLSNAPDPGNVFVTPFSLSSLYGHLVIVDNLGVPVFYRRTERWVYDFKKQPNGLLTYSHWGPFFFALDSTYAVVDSFRAGNGYALTDLHDLLLLDNGHALLMVKDPQTVHMDSLVLGGHPNAQVTGLIIQELDADKNVVFQWRSWDHFEISDGSVSGYVSLTDSLIDYVHGNALEVDWDGNILLSSRHMNEITKIDRQTGDILWRFGPNAVHNDFTVINDPRGFSHQHDIRRLPNGNITLFDNGNFLVPAYSRMVEYQLDEINKVATLVAEYRNTPDSYGPAMGGAQRHASGGTTIGWGMVPSAPHVTEIHSDGSKAFELGFDPGTFTYRAFRFPWTMTRFATSADTLDFGSLMLDETAMRSVVVRNTWTSDVTITSLVSSDPDFGSPTTLPFTLSPGDSATVDVTFDPVWITDTVAHLYIRAEKATELVSQTVVLTGRAGTVTDVSETNSLPSRYRLYPSSPNPFNPATTIRYDVPRSSLVTLAVYDTRGRRVATLVQGLQSPGVHEARSRSRS